MRPRAKAVDDAYRRAHESPRAGPKRGRTLGELSYASVDTFENVRPMPMAGAMMKMNVAGAPAPTEEFTPQSISVTAHVNALFSFEVESVGTEDERLRPPGRAKIAQDSSVVYAWCKPPRTDRIILECGSHPEGLRAGSPFPGWCRHPS